MKMKSNLLHVFLWMFLCTDLWTFPFQYGGLTAEAHAADSRDRIEVEGEGEAEIVDQDISGASKNALELAKKAAFSRALSEAVPERVSLSEQQELANRLSPRLHEFLVQYRFEEMSAAGVMFVTLHATFSRASFIEEFHRRGLFLPQGDADGTSEGILLTIRGIRSSRTYRQILEQLPRKVEGIRSAVPYEVFGDELTLKVLVRGDPGVVESAVREALTEIAPGESALDGGLGVFVSRIPSGDLDDGQGSERAGNPSAQHGSLGPSR